MFISILWYDHVDDYEFFWLKNGLSSKIYLGEMFFKSFDKNKMIFFLNGKLLSNKGFF